ncbi:cytochrome c [Pedobacter sp. CG_S7]|uniref:ThuA domain-containing protein n=1 Tax=Pedobacter sp. CG_S7 TaxID=3143930 RepID=UPI0033940218
MNSDTSHQTSFRNKNNVHFKIKSFIYLAHIICIGLFMLFSSCNKRSGKPRILVFTKTAGFYHESIPLGVKAIEKLGNENNFEVDTTSNADFFIQDSLKKYAAIVFLHTTGDLLNHYQEAEFERYIQAGGGFMGVHAAADAEYDWGWYNRLVGASFESHPEQQEAVLNVIDQNDPSTSHLPKQWKRKDEWYNFKKISKDLNILITIDESSYKGGKNGGNHPMAWYHDFEGGRSFYTELGHTDESFQEPMYLKHILGGINYAIGENKKLDYDAAKTLQVPEEDRFVKTMLSEGSFFEPTEMAILPNFDILVAQRRGELMLYDNTTKKVKQAGFLNVYYKTTTEGVNAEEGLLGITADPDFNKNNYIYLFYSPSDTSVNRLSRFVFKNGTLDNKSEKVIIQFYSQREICCHTGGSVTFGNDRMIYISTGDNSTPFDEKGQAYANHGFAPLNDDPGHLQYDSRRSAGNPNDLRGKILRIKINEDGSYSIPEDNLFAKDNPKTRPEIYVMGNRNPYRISIDKKTGYLYWGEVGPDASVDSLDTRGPKGYDEMNQARKAGNFGWPLFIGNNIPYRQYNYTTGQSGEVFDPAKPLNNSRNNSGQTQLPPAQSAFIWYPYGPSKEFPQMGTGGRTAMTGPVYYTKDYPKEHRYPEYYNGKLFIYEWIRNWIKVVTMQPNGDFDKMEPFMEHTKFKSPIDMEVGPDGRIYILEYGSGWFSKNPDAGLSRLDYISGNLPPKVSELKVDKTSGNLPLQIKASVTANDPEKGSLTYLWSIGTVTKETKEPFLTYTINKPGDYDISVNVMDKEKASTKSNTLSVYAGNEEPRVIISLQGNKSFYFPSLPVVYDIHVDDKGEAVDLKNLYVSTDYVQGTDMSGSSMGHQVISETILGKNLMLSMDCKSCHQLDKSSIGPAFIKVAQRYSNKPDAYAQLTQKVIKGSSGVWGEAAMPAHPSLKVDDAKKIIQWILSLSNEASKKKSLLPNGKILVKGDPKKQDAVFAMTATYTDSGNNGSKPLSGTRTVYLKNSLLKGGDFSTVSGFETLDSAGTKYLRFPAKEGYLKLSKVDLSKISGLQITGEGKNFPADYKIEIRTGETENSLIGSGSLKFNANRQKYSVTIAIKPVIDGKAHDLYLYVKAAHPLSAQLPIFLAVQLLSK